MMKFWPALISATAAALTVVSCGSPASSPPPSPASGGQAASSARAPVAEQFWNVLGTVYPDIQANGAPGSGSFSVCPAGSGQQPRQVSYNITAGIVPRDQQLVIGQFLTRTEQALQAKGWGAFAPYQANIVYLGSTMRSVKDGYHVYLTKQAGGSSGIVLLTVGGPCVTVGTAFASAAPGLDDRMADQYPLSAVSARPVPTQPLPSP
jgi:hypothetical protein